MSPEAQVAWFKANDVGAKPWSIWAQYYVNSVGHKGVCCPSCVEDEESGYMEYDPERCCCRMKREESDAPVET